MNNKKVVLSALSKHDNVTGHRIIWKDFRVVCRDENPYTLLFKESLLIRAYRLEVNRTTHFVPLIVVSDGFTTDMLSDPDGYTNVYVFSHFVCHTFEMTCLLCLSIESHAV
jgi:hypothetical protein